MALNSRNLSASSLLSSEPHQEDDPMSSMGNLMDVMLVFACALMIALITHYNVDFSSSDAVISDYETIEESELTEASISDEDGDSSYYEVGILYEDSETGELVVLKPEED